MLTKKERIRVSTSIGYLHENYCEHCLEEGKNTKSTVCVKCPVDVKIKELGRILENKPVIKKRHMLRKKGLIT